MLIYINTFKPKNYNKSATPTDKPSVTVTDDPTNEVCSVEVPVSRSERSYIQGDFPPLIDYI